MMFAVAMNLRYALGLMRGGSNAVSLPLAIAAVNDALKAANRINNPAAKRTCMRVLNWLRADLRRAA